MSFREWVQYEPMESWIILAVQKAERGYECKIGEHLCTTLPLMEPPPKRGDVIITTMNGTYRVLLRCEVIPPFVVE